MASPRHPNACTKESRTKPPDSQVSISYSIMTLWMVPIILKIKINESLKDRPTWHMWHSGII